MQLHKNTYNEVILKRYRIAFSLNNKINKTKTLQLL
jgi:uncharacterized protein YehS (DUF1456 family)